jgi:DNA-binding NarL/FixJ family response regulator
MTTTTPAISGAYSPNLTARRAAWDQARRREQLNPPDRLYRTVLETSDTGVAVLDEHGRPRYVNAAGRRLLGADAELSPEIKGQLHPMLLRVRASGRHITARWALNDLVLRASVRPLAENSVMTVLELTVARAGRALDPAGALARCLQLKPANALLLSLLWRGLRNDEIAVELNAPVGTIKSRLFRLYKRLGARNRAAAVLVAADVLGGA